MDALYNILSDSHTVASILVGICVIATVLTIAIPMTTSDTLNRRMKSVASERERIRARERAATKNQAVSIRHAPKQYMKRIVDYFSLSRWLHAEGGKATLASAGYRGPQAEIAFLFFRLVSPIGFLIASIVYLTFFDDHDFSMSMKALIAVASTYLGVKAPEIFLSNVTSKRQASMRQAFPDALDLMLICVESGMSIEHAFRKIGQEIGVQSVPLAEEFVLATAELSYLPDRRVAYTNLSARTGLDGVKQISTVLIQAEKYGTPLGKALRVTAQEGRDMRMMEAERKAASLPPKLTVPMIVFFLPVLLVVVLGPAVLGVMSQPGGIFGSN